MLNSSDVADKWQRNLAASTDSIKKGVLAVTTNPAEKAAARADAYAAGVQAAVASGKYQRGLRRTTLSSWQSATIDKGLMRIGSGATQAKPKMQAFMDKFLPHVQALQGKLASMPRGDYQQNVQRMLAAVDHMHSFAYSG